MQEPNQNFQSDFMIEKIKERPVNRKKLLRRTIITASMAVIFGLIACVTFLLLEPVISNLMYPEEEPQIVVFPEDQEEMSPEEMLAENMPQESQPANPTSDTENPESVTLEQEQIDEILAEMTLNIDNYSQMYVALSEYTEELNRYMVTVTGITSNVDWFNNVQEQENQAAGVIIANNGKELLILTDYSPLKNAEILITEFYNDTTVQAKVKGVDTVTNLAVLSVDLIKLDRRFLADSLYIAPLGSSNVKNFVGTPVIAVGRPMGISDSMGYGMITSASGLVSKPDANFKLIQTDIAGSQNAGGVLFNLKGEVIGMITTGKTGSDMKNMITAYGITDLKKRIEKISNDQQIAYLGISAADVTEVAHEEMGVPFGAYITEIKMDSPAMQAGILEGDVLVSVNQHNIVSFGEYTTLLMQLKVGDSVDLTVKRQVQDDYREMEFELVLNELE